MTSALRRALLLGLLVLAVVVSALPAVGQSRTPDSVRGVRADELHVMSFNLRYASDTPPNSWPERRPVTASLLRRERPHIIGTQEGVYEQLKDIEEDLGHRYESIGIGRDGGSRGEFMMIFYDARRLEPLEYDHFWLSDTPEVIGSQTWGGCCPRMVTWVRFLDTRTDEEFYLVNTHFEAFSAEARELSAELLVERVAEFDQDLPVIVTGDFNAPAEAGNAVYDTLVTDGPFVDTWETGATTSELWGTFHGYNPLTAGGARIDWVLTTPDVDTRLAVINTYAEDGQFPSDHLPVSAVVRLPED